MFLIISINSKINPGKYIGLKFDGTRLSHTYIGISYSVLSFFFLPLIKWDKKYVIYNEYGIFKEIDYDYYLSLINKYDDFLSEDLMDYIYQSILDLCVNTDNVDELYNSINELYHINKYENDIIILIENVVALYKATTYKKQVKDIL